MASEDQDIAAALAASARAIAEQPTLAQTLEAIVRSVRVSVPGFDHAGISIVHRGGRVETMAATGDLVWELDRLQYELGEGPCVSALLEEPVVVAPHLRHAQRWPRYVGAAVRTGLRAQLALRLYVQDKTLGGLNLYSTESDEIAPEALHAAEPFATHAALALGHARRESELHEAMQTRMVIGQAVGMIMERYGLDAERSFQFLVRTSSTANLKLRDIAQRVVDDHEGSAARPEHSGPDQS